MTFSIGPYALAAPVVLAPMAGVTNAPFRELCRRFAPGLVYVNEMVMATPVVHGNAKTDADDQLRRRRAPAQPAAVRLRPGRSWAQAVHKLCDAGRVDHIDINFGCPAAKVTRRGGGAAVPARPELLRAILRAAVSNAVAVRRAGDGQVPHGAVRRLAHPHPHRRGRAPRRASRRSRCTPAPSQQHYSGEARLGRDRRAEGRRSDRSPCSATATSGRPHDAVRDDGRHRLRRRRHRSRLPRPAVAVRRPRRGAVAAARRPSSRVLGEVMRRDARPRPPARRRTWARTTRCATSASTPAGT